MFLFNGADAFRLQADFVLLLKPDGSLSCFPVGPGLSIRVICAEEPYVCKDFAETNNILKIVTDFSASVKKVSKLDNKTCFLLTFLINVFQSQSVNWFKACAL